MVFLAKLKKKFDDDLSTSSFLHTFLIFKARKKRLLSDNQNISATIFHFNEVFNKVYFRTIFYGLHVVSHIRLFSHSISWEIIQIMYFDRSFKKCRNLDATSNSPSKEKKHFCLSGWIRIFSDYFALRETFSRKFISTSQLKMWKCGNADASRCDI